MLESPDTHPGEAMTYRENRWYEICEICYPEETDLIEPFTKRICIEHLEEVKSSHGNDKPKEPT